MEHEMRAYSYHCRCNRIHKEVAVAMEDMNAIVREQVMLSNKISAEADAEIFADGRSGVIIRMDVVNKRWNRLQNDDFVALDFMPVL